VRRLGPADASGSQRAIVRGARLLLRAFFRRIEVTGTRHVPEDRGALLVAWHPNGLVDPGLVIAYSPRPVVFGARDGLFRWPILGTVLRRLDTVPIHRAIDRPRDATSGDPAASEDARRQANRASVDALARRVASGSLSALFPEGDSHDESRVQRLKTGAAHLYYRAREVREPGTPPPAIVPVGLHYDHKAVFRSSALVAFHPPMQLDPDLDVDPRGGESEDERTARAQRLTAAIEVMLHDVVHATEDWNVHHLLHRTRRLLRAEAAARAGVDPGASQLGERVLGFSQVRAAYEAVKLRAPRRLAALRRRLEDYDAELRALGLTDYDLDRAPRLGSPWLVLLSVLQLVGVFLLLPPIVTIGYAANLPPAALVWLVAKAFARRIKDEATVKLLVGAIVFPITWALVGVLAASIHTQLAAGFRGVPAGAIGTGVLAGITAAVGGAAAVRYVRVARESARAITVRFTRARGRDAIARLLQQRARLRDDLVALALAPME
jgi:1-acyl-sn-glycerol-3-phosphate acyltransferase